MEGFKKNKAVGFYITIASMILAIITDIVYVVSYGSFLLLGTTAINWGAVGLLIAGSVIGGGMYVLKLERYIHYVLAVFYGIAFFFFIYGIYYYVSIMAYGIDAKFDNTFFLNAGLFVVLLFVSIGNVFVKQLKDEE